MTVREQIERAAQRYWPSRYSTTIKPPWDEIVDFAELQRNEQRIQSKLEAYQECIRIAKTYISGTGLDGDIVAKQIIKDIEKAIK